MVLLLDISDTYYFRKKLIIWRNLLTSLTKNKKKEINKCGTSSVHIIKKGWFPMTNIKIIVNFKTTF